MISFSFVLLTTLCLILAPLNGAMYMVVSERRCFSIEKPRDTPISFRYELLDAGDKISFTLYYGNEANKDMNIMTITLEDALGSIDYVTDVDGAHLYCIAQISAETHHHHHLKDQENPGNTKTVNHVGEPRPSRVKVYVSYGWDENHYSKIAKEENFDSVNMEIRKINDMMDLALAEADYQKYKEMEYHSEVEAMNAATLWWPVAQICILLVIAGFQVRHLKSFFKKNKLI